MSLKMMLFKLLRSIILGLIAAAILLLLYRSIKNNIHETIPVSYSRAVSLAAPAVVNVYNHSVGNLAQVPLTIRMLGSGVIMSDKGYILTNKHVINYAEKIIVALQDGRIYEASLVGSDALTDLAVLKIEADNLPVISINLNQVTHVGDVVLAIGNPYNLGQTITQGIISATGRVGLSDSGRQNFLQTDASINRGNSGGALVNSLGQLVGINTLSFDKSSNGEIPEGIGFAIPTALATKVMQKLIRDGRVIRGFIGITGDDYPQFNLTNANKKPIQGIKVNKILPEGPAAAAGIRIGDIILSVNDIRVISTIETMDQVAEIQPGTVIPVLILRDEQQIMLKIIISEYPDS